MISSLSAAVVYPNTTITIVINAYFFHLVEYAVPEFNHVFKKITMTYFVLRMTMLIH